MKRLHRTLACALLAGGLASIPIAAHAAYAAGSLGYYSVNGIQYYNQAAINTSSGFATASTFTGPTQICVTAGSLAAQGRVIKQYQQSGAVLVSESTVKYSTGTVCSNSGMSASASYAGTGDFYSYGRSYAFNSSTGGYAAFMTIASPIQQA